MQLVKRIFEKTIDLHLKNFIEVKCKDINEKLKLVSMIGLLIIRKATLISEQ